MSAAALQFESRPIVRTIRDESNLDKALAAVQKAEVEELSALCPGTNASLVFYAAQRKVDESAATLCKTLVECGACDPQHKDSNGQTAVFFAARDGNAACVTYLLQAGAHADQRDSAAQTALFYAARDGRTACVSALLDAGASVNAADNLGQTALFYGARDGRRETVEVMLQRGADVNVRDRCRRTAAFYAGKNNHHDLVDILRQHGGEQDSAEPSETGAPAPARTLKRQRTSGLEGAATEGVRRKCYRLAVKVPESCGGGFRSAPHELVEVFEREFPQVAVWDKSHRSPVENIYHDLVSTWQAIGLRVIEQLTSYDGGWIFSQPVDCKAWCCPDYFDVIKQPMDYSKIKRKFRARQYNRCSEFVADMALVFSNCFCYNKPDSAVAAIARTVQQVFTTAMDESGLRDILEQEEKLGKWYDGLLKELGISNSSESDGNKEPAVKVEDSGDSKTEPV